MSAIKFVSLECAAALVAIGIWLGTGHQTYLFIAGMAFGAAVTAGMVEWEMSKTRAAELRERIDA